MKNSNLCRTGTSLAPTLSFTNTQPPPPPSSLHRLRFQSQMTLRRHQVMFKPKPESPWWSQESGGWGVGGCQSHSFATVSMSVPSSYPLLSTVLSQVLLVSRFMPPSLTLQCLPLSCKCLMLRSFGRRLSLSISPLYSSHLPSAISLLSFPAFDFCRVFREPRDRSRGRSRCFAR